MRKMVVILTLNLFLNGCAYHYQIQTPFGLRKVTLDEALGQADTIDDIDELERQAQFGGDPYGKIRQKRLQIYVKTHPELSNRIKDCILKGAICTGMTIEDVKQAWNHLDWQMSSRSADGSAIWDGFTPRWKMIEYRWYNFRQTKVTLYFGKNGKLEVWTEWPD